MSESEQPNGFRRYAVACTECGWETDVVGGRIMPYHTVRRMTRDGIQPTDEYCPGSGREAERVPYLPQPSQEPRS